MKNVLLWLLVLTVVVGFFVASWREWEHCRAEGQLVQGIIWWECIER